MRYAFILLACLWSLGASAEYVELFSNFTAGSTFSPQENEAVRALGRETADGLVDRNIPTFIFSPERTKEASALNAAIMKEADATRLPDPFWESVMTLSLILEKGPLSGKRIDDYLSSKAGRKFRAAIYWEPKFIVSLDIALSSAAHWFDRYADTENKGTPRSLDNPQIARIHKLIRNLEDWTIPIQPELLREYAQTREAHERKHPSAVPASTLLSPTAFGADWGTVFIAAGLENRPRYSDALDGAGSIGFGIGDARNIVGLEISYTLFVLKKLFPWASPGGINFKLHRILPRGFAVAVGCGNLIQWDTALSGRSFFGVVSKTFVRSWNSNDFASQIFLHAGIGTGVFNPTSAIIAGTATVSPFFAASVRLSRALSVTTNWYGSDLGLGFSIAPFETYRFTITPQVQDLLGISGNGPRAAIALAFSHSFVDY